MMPLAMAKEGEEVKIHIVNCGRVLKARLCDLGLYEGSKVKVIKNDISGPIILKIKGSKIVLGRGQAHQIMAKVITEGENE